MIARRSDLSTTRQKTDALSVPTKPSDTAAQIGLTSQMGLTAPRFIYVGKARMAVSAEDMRLSDSHMHLPGLIPRERHGQDAENAPVLLARRLMAPSAKVRQDAALPTSSS
jgi:hypothetical protein